MPSARAAGLVDRLTAPFVHRTLLGLVAFAAGVGLFGERNLLSFLPRASFAEGRWLGSPWFIGAMALAALSGWFQALRNSEATWARRCLQLAPLVLVVGLVTTALLGRRVPVDLRVGGTSGPIAAAGGLRLRLEALKTDPRPPAFRLAAYTRPDGLGGFEAEPRPLAEAVGTEGKIPGTALRYRVESVIPHGLPNGALVNDPASPVNPALHVLLGLSQPNPLEGFLLARDPRRARFDEPGGRFAVVVQERFDPATLVGLKAKSPARERLVLTVQGTSLEHEARVGSTWGLPTFSLQVEALYPDFVATPGADHQPHFGTRSAAPLNPWVQVRLRQPGGASAVLMLAAHPPADPSYAQYLREVLPPGVELRYVREGEDPVDRFVLFTLADARVRLVVAGKVLREVPLEYRKPFTVAQGLSATPLEVFPRARFEEDWQPHPDPVQATRYENPVAKVSVSNPSTGAAETRWLAARGPQGPRPVAYQGGSLALLFKKREPEPEQVHATLSLVDEGGEARVQGLVDVGAPLRPSLLGLLSVHADWETTNDPAAFRALVVRDPGRPILLFGLMQLGLGLVGLLVRRA